MRKVFTLLLCLAVMATLVACAGGSEADKAYDSWAKNTVPKMDAADTEYNTKVEEVAQGDFETALAILDEYISVLRPAVEELAAIDMNALTGERKATAPGQLEALQAKLQQCEDGRVLYAQQLGQGAGSDEEPVYNEDGEGEQ